MLSEVLDLDAVATHIDSLYAEVEQGNDWEVVVVLNEARTLIAELRASRKVVEAARIVKYDYNHVETRHFLHEHVDELGAALAELATVNARSEEGK